MRSNKVFKLFQICIFGILFIFVLFSFVWRNFYTNFYVNTILSLKASFIRGSLMHNPYMQLGKSPPPKKAVRHGKSFKRQNEHIYGGIGDPSHLGGWIDFDPRGVSNMTWDYMIGVLGVKSLLDIGCGRGYSTNYFLSKGAKVLCIEGSAAAIAKTHLPSTKYIVEHDYTLGPYWPDDTFDACWSVEFLEHVSRQYFINYINSFRQCALIFMTVSPVDGYHHVEVHGEYWWQGRFMSAGFYFFKELTDMIKRIPYYEKYHLMEVYKLKDRYNNIIGPFGQYIEHTMMVFINPTVASLPKHDHLFAGEGCFNESYGNTDGGKPCEGLDALPVKYNSLIRCYRDLENAKKYKLPLHETFWTCVPRE